MSQLALSLDRPVQEPPCPGHPDYPLYRALRRLWGNERWNERCAAGMSDDEIRAFLDYEWGLGMGSGGPGEVVIWHRGGRNPAFWLGYGPAGKPTLTGKALLAAIRRLMGVNDAV